MITLLKYIIPILSAIYIASPVDLVPDVIPVAGWIDDAAAFLIGLSSCLKGLSMARSRRQKTLE